MMETNRGNLLQAFMDRKLSKSTQMQTSAKLRDLTDQQREERAGQILTMLQESKTEQEFISKMENM